MPLDLIRFHINVHLVFFIKPIHIWYQKRACLVRFRVKYRLYSSRLIPGYKGSFCKTNESRPQCSKKIHSREAICGFNRMSQYWGQLTRRGSSSESSSLHSPEPVFLHSSVSSSGFSSFPTSCTLLLFAFLTDLRLSCLIQLCREQAENQIGFKNCD